jgi:hypothetical protein
VKQDNMIFLILLVAVAMVMGSTFAIVSTLTTYKSHHAENAVINDPQSQGAVRESENDSAPTPEYTSAGIGLPVTNDTSEVLSPAETREVKRMLAELGYTSPTLSESLESFQQEYQITSTGILDGLTLDSIITQLSLHKARSF